MHCPRHKFLAGSTFAIDQNRALSGGNRADGLLELVHRHADAHNVVERIASGGIALECEILAAQRHLFERTVNCQFNFIHQAGRLADVIRSASRLDCFHCGFVIIDSGNQDYCRLWRHLMSMPKHFDAVSIRHLDVGYDDVINRGVKLSFGVVTGLHCFNFVTIPAQSDVQHFTDGALVITYKNITHDRPLRPQMPQTCRLEPPSDLRIPLMCSPS